MNIQEYENYHENKVHADSLFPYNTYLCSIPIDFTEVPNHWHDDMEIIYIKKGHGIVSLDLVDTTVHGGDIVIVLPGRLHGIRQLGLEAMEYENIIFSTSMFITRFSDTIDTEFFTPLLSGQLEFESIVTPQNPSYLEFVRCLDHVDEICSTFPKGYKLAIKATLYQFFYNLYASSTEVKEKSTSKSLDRMKEVLKYIEENYAAPITIDEIASVAGFSASHFMKFFKQAAGSSFVDYLNNYRLSMATRLLVSSEGSVLDIAQSCGYDNLSYFNRIFKKRYSMTPREYRRSFVQN